MTDRIDQEDPSGRVMLLDAYLRCPRCAGRRFSWTTDGAAATRRCLACGRNWQPAPARARPGDDPQAQRPDSESVSPPGAPVRPVRMLLADASSDFRRVARIALEVEQGVEVVAEAGTAAAAVQLAAAHRPDVVLFDLDLEGLAGLEALTEIRRRSPSSRLIVISVFPDAFTLGDLLGIGADLYLDKVTCLPNLPVAVRSLTEDVIDLRAPSRRRKLGAKTAVLAMALVLTAGSAAAAATGTLPRGAQARVSDFLSRVGVPVPEPRSARPTSAKPKAEADPATGEGEGKGKGAEISKLAQDPELHGVEKGAAVSTEASDGKSQAGDRGAAVEQQSVAPADRGAPASPPAPSTPAVTRPTGKDAKSEKPADR